MATFETNEVLTFLGIDENAVDSFDSFREMFENEYIKKSVIKDPKSNEYKELLPTFVGKVTGSTQTALNRKLKEFGIELDANEIKDKRIEDVVETGISKLAETFNSKISAFESQASKGSEEINRESESKLAAMRKKYEELEAAHNNLKNQYEESENTWKSALKTEKVSNIIAKEHEKIKWKVGVKDIEKEGFFARLKNNYQIDYDESTGQLDVFDSKGSRIPNQKKSGTWKTYSEILEEEGLKSEVWSANDNANKTNAQSKSMNVRLNANTQQQPSNTDGRIRKVSNRVK